MEKSIRRLKVYSKYVSSRSVMWLNPKRPLIYPQIILQGRWLEDLGFVEGYYVKVETEHKKVTLTMIDETEMRA